jgi:type II secretory pathway predicted ATPase ExeA
MAALRWARVHGKTCTCVPVIIHYPTLSATTVSDVIISDITDIRTWLLSSLLFYVDWLMFGS